jgi:hypothetical protein
VKKYLSRSESRFWAVEAPVGDPFGGPAYGLYADPATVMIVGTAVGAVGSLQSAQASANAARYNAQINDQNAVVAQSQGKADAFQQEQIGYRSLSAIRAATGASGLQMTGSPLDVLSSSASQAELDVQKVKYNASLKALGYTNNAALDRNRAKNAEISGLFGAASTSLIGGSRAAGMRAIGAGTPIPVNLGDNYGYTG